MFIVNRMEVIDHTATGEGRDYVKWLEENFVVELQLQDDDRTLKIFLRDDEVKEDIHE